tara:strand:- start:52 stop:528 length:477 start_codon:yes stop_codon:yes gene_type:complete
MHKQQFRLFADYFQLYLMDDSSEDDTSEIWTEEALERRLGIGGSTLALGTLRNVDVNLIVEVLPEAPSVDEDEWDHIVTGYISVSSGSLAVFGCTDYLPDAYRIPVEPGEYDAVYRCRGLDTIKVEWEDADDLYVISIWPGSDRESKIIKNWKPNNDG